MLDAIFSKRFKVSVSSAVALWLGLEISYFIWYKLKKVLIETNEDSDSSKVPVNDVVFFDSGSAQCLFDGHNPDKCERKNCMPRNMRLLSQLMENAETSINICMYKLSSCALATHLTAAITNGVKVRVLCHGKIDDHSKALTNLQLSGAFVRGKEYTTGKALLMHHKFLVIDSKILITGSLNWTHTGIIGNWEDAAIITDPCIVEKYEKEFQYLWDNYKTSVELLPMSVNPPIFPDNLSAWKETPFNEVFMFREDTASCRSHMSSLKFELQPPDHAPVCAYTVLGNFEKLLRTAEASIEVCQLLINLENIGNVFRNGFERGLKVRVISDSHMAGCSGSQIKSLIEYGVEVRGLHHHSNMHHKFIILDKKLVLFGSFNWTMQALCGNSESLVCTNNEDITKKFIDQFEDMWDEFLPIEVEKIGQRNFVAM